MLEEIWYQDHRRGECGGGKGDMNVQAILSTDRNIILI